MRRILPYVANAVIITNLIFLLFIIITQKQMCWWAIIFREAHSALLTRPRFQSNKRETKVQERGATEKRTLVRTDARRRF
jgi:hypothetical protein